MLVWRWQIAVTGLTSDLLEHAAAAAAAVVAGAAAAGAAAAHAHGLQRAKFRGRILFVIGFTITHALVVGTAMVNTGGTGSVLPAIMDRPYRAGICILAHVVSERFKAGNGPLIFDVAGICIFPADTLVRAPMAVCAGTAALFNTFFQHNHHYRPRDFDPCSQNKWCVARNFFLLCQSSDHTLGRAQPQTTLG